jgi:NADPH:quinone reductase-like Zn-dependent oxidoreductase
MGWIDAGKSDFENLEGFLGSASVVLGDEVICTADEDLRARLQELNAGKDVERAIDCVAGELGAEVARNLAPTETMLVYGALSSHRQTDPAKFIMPLTSLGCRRKSMDTLLATFSLRSEPSARSCDTEPRSAVTYPRARLCPAP